MDRVAERQRPVPAGAAAAGAAAATTAAPGIAPAGAAPQSEQAASAPRGPAVAARQAEGDRTWPVVVDAREGRVDVVVHARDVLRAGDELHGPVVVTEPTSTTYVQPEWTVVVDGMGNLVARAA